MQTSATKEHTWGITTLPAILSKVSAFLSVKESNLDSRFSIVQSIRSEISINRSETSIVQSIQLGFSRSFSSAT